MYGHQLYYAGLVAELFLSGRMPDHNTLPEAEQLKKVKRGILLKKTIASYFYSFSFYFSATTMLSTSYVVVLLLVAEPVYFHAI